MEIVPCPRCDAPMQQEEGFGKIDLCFFVCPACGCRQINNVGIPPVGVHTPEEEKQICEYALKRSEEIRQAELVAVSFCWECDRFYVEGCFTHQAPNTQACSRFIGGTS